MVLLKTPTKSRWISPTRTNRKRQGASAIHMSHVYQNCQRANGLAWTAWMKNQNIVAMNIRFLKTHRHSRILHSRTTKKTWQIMWRKRIFKWQPSKLLWIWIFGAVIKVRTTEKNYYLGRLLWSCLQPQAGRGTQRGYSSKPLNIALLNVFQYLNGRYRHIFIP